MNPRRENPQAVINWQNWLNTNHPPATWVPMQGFTSLLVSLPKEDGSVTYNLNSGYPLKSFLNTQTGEVKSFAAHNFYA